jgi:hypothetical protein
MTVSTRRYRRRIFAVAVGALVIVVIVVVIHVRLNRKTASFPSWGQLPAPQALTGPNALKPCALGNAVPARLIPVVAWSGADEEWCNSSGIQAVAFDGPAIAVWAAGVTVHRDGLVTADLGGRFLVGTFWAVPYGWVALVVWGNPNLPTNTPALLLGLRQSALAAQKSAVTH